MMRAVTRDSDTEEDIAVVMMNRAKLGQLICDVFVQFGPWVLGSGVVGVTWSLGLLWSMVVF